MNNPIKIEPEELSAIVALVGKELTRLCHQIPKSGRIATLKSVYAKVTGKEWEEPKKKPTKGHK